MEAIRRDFMPEDLKTELDRHDVAGCIAVQVDQTEAETEFLLTLAEQFPFIKGVVGWVDLRSRTIEEQLHALSGHKKLCGFRHIVQGESDVNFLLRPDFIRGVRWLQSFDFTYDILVYPFQLGAALEFVRKLPDQKLVIDHIAKPYIKDQYIDGWAVLMKEIATYPHVHCKISGVITEAAWHEWTYDQIAPYLDIVFEAFGPERVMYGSDWPVCLLSGAYSEVIGLVERYTEGFSAEDKERLFGLNGQAFYGVDLTN